MTITYFNTSYFENSIKVHNQKISYCLYITKCNYLCNSINPIYCENCRNLIEYNPDLNYYFSDYILFDKKLNNYYYVLKNSLNNKIIKNNNLNNYYESTEEYNYCNNNQYCNHPYNEFNHINNECNIDNECNDNYDNENTENNNFDQQSNISEITIKQDDIHEKNDEKNDEIKSIKLIISKQEKNKLKNKRKKERKKKKKTNQILNKHIEEDEISINKNEIIVAKENEISINKKEIIVAEEDEISINKNEIIVAEEDEISINKNEIIVAEEDEISINKNEIIVAEEDEISEKSLKFDKENEIKLSKQEKNKLKKQRKKTRKKEKQVKENLKKEEEDNLIMEVINKNKQQLIDKITKIGELNIINNYVSLKDLSYIELEEKLKEPVIFNMEDEYYKFYKNGHNYINLDKYILKDFEKLEMKNSDIVNRIKNWIDKSKFNKYYFNCIYNLLFFNQLNVFIKDEKGKTTNLNLLGKNNDSINFFEVILIEDVNEYFENYIILLEIEPFVKNKKKELKDKYEQYESNLLKKEKITIKESLLILNKEMIKRNGKLCFGKQGFFVFDNYNNLEKQYYYNYKK